ncbi:MAG: hypothetical protein DWQ01_06350 [Planctomycetota bacterium]|nr:MAG: hypothetical protein DWQ01_06350 [Planctomycetota bacterium]
MQASKFQILGLTFAIALSAAALVFGGPSHSQSRDSGSELERAVQAFNHQAADNEIGKDQPPLTSEAVVAAIRWNLSPSSSLVIADGTREALKNVVDQGLWPQDFELESLTGYEPDDRTVFTVWSVRLRVPGGPHNNGTTCIRIREDMLSSRIMGPAEMELVQEFQRRMQAGKVGSFERQQFLQERQQAMEKDRAR